MQETVSINYKENDVSSDNISNDRYVNISQIKDNGKLSPCVIIDTFEGMVHQCGNTTNLRLLWQLIRMWQVDKEIVNKENSLKHLGCVKLILCLITCTKKFFSIMH